MPTHWETLIYNPPGRRPAAARGPARTSLHTEEPSSVPIRHDKVRWSLGSERDRAESSPLQKSENPKPYLSIQRGQLQRLEPVCLGWLRPWTCKDGRPRLRRSAWSSTMRGHAPTPGSEAPSSSRSVTWWGRGSLEGARRPTGCYPMMRPTVTKKSCWFSPACAPPSVPKSNSPK